MSQKRQDIIETAFRLFSENGFYATGIDQIIAESNTSKKTFYYRFKSKMDLVVAVLGHYEESFFNQLNKELLKHGSDPCTQLIKLFEIAQGWYRSKKFNGCLAISAMSEFGNKDKHVVEACASFKHKERVLLLSIVKDMNVADPDKVADYLMILLEGIGATAHMRSLSPSSGDIRKLIESVCANAQ